MQEEGEGVGKEILILDWNPVTIPDILEGFMKRQTTSAASGIALVGMLVVFALQVRVSLHRARFAEMEVRYGGRIAYGYDSCGNGSVEGAEECDDGNIMGLDGCGGTCAVETGWSCDGSSPSVCSSGCGDSIRSGAETCDDGNATASDGCSASCSRETGYVCTNASPNVCTSTCGNGRKAAGEGCDDANTTAADGCSATCTVESGWSCTSTNDEQNTCTSSCGDGTRISAEACNDGNTSSGDGCSATCSVETGYTCSGAVGAQSSCSTTCGDGARAGAEACDDGNASNADSCTNSCVAAACGDGYKNGGEQCDPTDASDPNKNGCSATCGLVSGGGSGGSGGTGGVGSVHRSTTPEVYYEEQKTIGGPRPACGNGIVEPDKGEECDSGSKNTGPDCSPKCKLLRCGDGIVTIGRNEECEPPKDFNGAFMNPLIGPGGLPLTCGARYCALPMRTDAGEWTGGCAWVSLSACSKSQAAGSQPVPSMTLLSPMSSTPTTSMSDAEAVIREAIEAILPNAPSIPETYVPVCGDGKLEGFGQEECDDGNTIPGDGCSATCALEPLNIICGNNTREGNEQCDDGSRNSSTEQDACRVDCTLPRCGDGVRDSSEECDDGNDVAGDGCTPTCRGNVCGDGILDPGEECDNGFRNSDQMSNACSSNCLLPRCGNGIPDDAFGEQCDNGAQNSNIAANACRLNCARASCGDGTVDSEEECDDGNFIGGDGCSSECVLDAMLLPPSTTSTSSATPVVPGVFGRTVEFIVNPAVRGAEWIARMLGL